MLNPGCLWRRSGARGVFSSDQDAVGGARGCAASRTNAAGASLMKKNRKRALPSSTARGTPPGFDGTTAGFALGRQNGHCASWSSVTGLAGSSEPALAAVLLARLMPILEQISSHGELESDHAASARDTTGVNTLAQTATTAIQLTTRNLRFDSIMILTPSYRWHSHVESTRPTAEQRRKLSEAGLWLDTRDDLR
jgi:hypothetical protein